MSVVGGSVGLGLTWGTSVGVRVSVGHRVWFSLVCAGGAGGIEGIGEYEECRDEGGVKFV